jgi:hypothetical protein
MRLSIVVLLAMLAFSGCVKKNKVPTAQNQTQAVPTGMHEVKVAEVIQSSNYTYLKVTENGTESWLAVNRMEAAPGQTYYYGEGLEMKNFHSKELNRDFETIYFVQDISTQAQPAAAGALPNPHGETMGKVSIAEKSGISVAPAENGLSIAKLYASKADYSGKKIKMKGQVVKVNDEVMGKNWVHIQDGSKDGDHFDLTITTLEKVAVDDVVTFEGTIAVNKDFGYGYAYELIMEDAKLVK